MGLIYLVRKKKFRTAEGIRELYFAIQRKLQKRGGKNEEDLAEILSANSSRSKGEVLSILTDLPDVIEEILKNGESVSIRGLGSFHASITSNGFEHPEDVLPHRGTGIQSIFHCRPQVYPTCQPDEILSLPTIQIFPKELVTTRNNQGRRDSGRETGVHS